MRVQGKSENTSGINVELFFVCSDEGSQIRLDILVKVNVCR